MQFSQPRKPSWEDIKEDLVTKGKLLAIYLAIIRVAPIVLSSFSPNRGVIQ